MSEEYTEEFVVEEEEGPNRSFLIIAGSLIGLFIVIAACTLGYILYTGGDGDDEVTDEEVAIRLTENAQTLAENARIAQTVEALTREAESAPEETPTPRPTLAPTNTPVSGPEAAPGGGATPETDATSVVEEDSEAEAAPPGQQQETATPTPTPTPSPTLAPITSGGADELPQTGFETVTLVIAGLAFLSLLLLARRLRSK